MYSSIDTCTMTNQEVNEEADIQTLVKQIFKKFMKLQKSLSKQPDTKKIFTIKHKMKITREEPMSHAYIKKKQSFDRKGK